MDIDKHIRRIWHKHEVEVGQRIRLEFKEAVKNLVGHYDEKYIEDFEASLPDYIKLGMAWGGAPSSSEDSTAIKSRRKYRKCFQRRLYLADFVLSRVYTPHELYLPLIENAPLPKRRVNWKTMVAEWNEAHLSDQMNSPVLKVEFYRAIREDDVMREILAREWRETERFLQLMQQFRDSYDQLMADLKKPFTWILGSAHHS